MKAIKLIPALLWRVLFFINLVLTLLILYPFFYVFLSKEKWFKHAFKLKKIWARFLTYDVGIFHKVEMKGKLHKKGVYVYCPNHTSYLDIMMSYLVIPYYFSFVGKAALAKIPLFGRFFTSQMDIGIKRESLKASFSAIEQANKLPHLLNFKNGPFKLAISRQVPIVPITFHNNYKILPHEKNYYRSGPGLARVTIHEPIPTVGMNEDTDLERLKKMVKDVIETELGLHKRQKVATGA